VILCARVLVPVSRPSVVVRRKNVRKLKFLWNRYEGWLEKPVTCDHPMVVVPFAIIVVLVLCGLTVGLAATAPLP
jgi:hypothetical protein